jgi:hypothetical protein
MRRRPEAIVAAHVMDPKRRELYVEGSRDRDVIIRLLNKAMTSDALVREIGTVHVDAGGPGGERGRLLTFAMMPTIRRIKNLRVFVDADYDRIFGRLISADNIVFTDHRDLEAYVLSEEHLAACVERLLPNTSVNCADLVRCVLLAARRIAAIRILSDERELSLPFQKTNLARRIEISGTAVNISVSDYLRALMQNAGISLADHDELMSAHQACEGRHGVHEVRDLLHGKDWVFVLERAVHRHAEGDIDIDSEVWVGFDRAVAQKFGALRQVLAFLEGRDLSEPTDGGPNS